MLKIVHIALNGPVTDNFSYQDNLLPKYHKKNGYDVSMITSKYIWNTDGNIEKDLRDEYYNEYGIKTIRLETKHNLAFNNKFKKYINLYETIEKERPDILFVHGVQSLDIKTIVNYIKNNLEIKVLVDNHADFTNSATNWLSKNILHKIIWKKCAKMIEPYTDKFYGVLPARVDFLVDMYDIPKEKVELLVMGADDDEVTRVKKSNSKVKIRNKYNIRETDLLVVTGGKIDLAKNEVLALMRAVKRIKQVKLLVFGSVVPELEEDFFKLVDGDKIQYAGWIESNESYDYFEAADIVVFPGRHSVFWEQVVAQGKPMVVKYWPGTTHIDLDGNVKFLYRKCEKEIYELLNDLMNNKKEITKMNGVAKSKGMKYFSYSNISKKSIKF